MWSQRKTISPLVVYVLTSAQQALDPLGPCVEGGGSGFRHGAAQVSATHRMCTSTPRDNPSHIHAPRHAPPTPHENQATHSHVREQATTGHARWRSPPGVHTTQQHPDSPHQPRCKLELLRRVARVFGDGLYELGNGVDARRQLVPCLNARWTTAPTHSPAPVSGSTNVDKLRVGSAALATWWGEDGAGALHQPLHVRWLP